MAISDYASLKASISNYLHRDDLSSFLGDIVQNGEIRLSHDLRPTPLLEEVTINVSSPAAKVALPSRTLEIVTITGGDDTGLEYVHPADFPRVAAQHTTAGYPLFYTWMDSFIHLAPAQADGLVTIWCYRYPERLTDANPTNWWTTYVPNLLLYSCLIEAESVVVNDTRMPVWRSLYEQGVNSMVQAYGTASQTRRKAAASTPTGRSTEVNPR